MKDIIWALNRIMENFPALVDKVLFFDLDEIIEFALTNDKYKLKYAGVKLIGQLMAFQDEITVKVY